MPSNRRLAAIMFCDIAGYTAMMQRNESDGMLRVKRYRQVLTDSVTEHGGEILQHYGDGSLCIFPSAVEAVACADAIQRRLREAPEVPLRIGIHLGDVVVEGQDIYGDGVNLASRVQSLSVPGGILLTERVLPDVKSHPRFRTVSLGKFNFKNVSQPIEVFALANEGLPLPTRQEVRRRLLAASATDHRVGAKNDNQRRSLLLGISAAVFILASLFIWLLNRPESGPKAPPAGISSIPEPPAPPPPPGGQSGEIPSIAVLPFEDMSPAGDMAYLGDGIAEEILHVLAQIEGLRVAGRTSSFSYKGKKTDLRSIGRELGVGTVLEGSVRRSGDRVRITAQLINTNDDFHLWSQTYEQRGLDDIFAIQDTIARSVVEKLRGILLPGRTTGKFNMPTRNKLAYEAYLRGKSLLSQRSDGAERAIGFLRRAVELDPEFAQAHAGLANAYLWLAWGNFMPSNEAFPQARKHAKEALRLSPDLAYAHALMGSVELWFDWNWEAARQSLQRAIDLNPNEATAFLDMGWYHVVSGNLPEAIRQMERAVSIDPLNLEYNIDLADAHRLAGQMDLAEKRIAAMREIFPGNSELDWMLGMIAYNQGRYEPALQYFRQSAARSGEDDWAVLHLVMGLARNGKTDEARTTLEKLLAKGNIEELAPVELAMAYLALGDRSRSLDLLEKAFKLKANWLISLKADPIWTELHGERRYQQLLRKMGF